MMKLLLLGGAFLASGLARAAADGGGGPADLLPAFLNLFILLGILFFILKKPVRDYYVGKSENVKNVLERANVKAKEAEMMMAAQRKKINSVADEIEKIYTETDASISKFRKDYSSEVDERIAKMKEDAASKIEAEKTEQINQLNSNFLDEVIAKAKASIKSNPELEKKATNNALEGIR